MKTVKIKILKIAQRTLRILRDLNGSNAIDRAYWAVLHRHAELARRKRMAAPQRATTSRRRPSRRVDGTGTVR
jgi:hypothetical protein